MEILYHSIIGIAVLAASPFIILKMGLDASFRRDIFDRMSAAESLPPLQDCLWIHASSVGEVRAAKILIQTLKEQTDFPIALSTFTRTGFHLAVEELDVAVFRLPLDFPIWLNPVFGKIKPRALVLIESEFWPSLLRQCHRRKVPVLLVNGRVSQRSTDRYGKAAWFFRWIAEGIQAFSMRSQTDADRLARLGIPTERITVTGNIKFDAPGPEQWNPVETGASGKPLTVVFGSTRPGDEGPVMEAVTHLRKAFPDINYVVAPRHIQRCQEVASLIKEFGLSYELHSRLTIPLEERKGALILLDRLGELNAYYEKAAVAFVGGGFNPRFGGQNILEPAAQGIPVIFGRHMNNFEEEARLLAESGGGIAIDSPQELGAVLEKLLNDVAERNRRGQAAWKTLRENRGAVERNIGLLKKLIENSETK